MAPQRASLFLDEGATRAGAIAFGSIGAFGSLLGEHGPELVLWILVVMGVDLASGLVRALVQPSDVERVDGGKFARGVLKKMAILMLLVVAAMVDRVMHLSELIAQGAGPTAMATMVGILMYEGASIVRNVQAVTGRAQFMVSLLRVVDEFRAFPAEKPDRRHYDPEPEEDAP